MRYVLFIAALLFWSAASAGNEFMPLGLPVEQPTGHYEFCRLHTGECGLHRVGEPIVLTKKALGDLLRINQAVNRNILPASDMSVFGEMEVWEYPENAGDCEDYVLEKRRRLMRAGYPASALLMTVVHQADGTGHAVLTVHTSRGDFVLDNLTDSVLLWTKTPYEFQSRQDMSHAGVWVRVLPVEKTVTLPKVVVAVPIPTPRDESGKLGRLVKK